LLRVSKQLKKIEIVGACSVLDVCFSFDVGRWTFDLPAMPLGGLGRMFWCLGPVDNDHPTIVCDAWQAGVGSSSFNMFDVHHNEHHERPLTFFTARINKTLCQE